MTDCCIDAQQILLLVITVALHPARCTEWCQKLPPTVVRLPSTAARERAPLRAGYLGHLTLVANRMIGAAGRRRTVKRFLDESDTWSAFLDGALKVRCRKCGCYRIAGCHTHHECLCP